MNFQNDLLLKSNINYSNKKPKYIFLLNLIFIIFLVYFIFYFLFCSIFFQAQVIGISMSPTFNENLDARGIGFSKEDYENSVFKDNVIVNKIDKGSNNDIILIQYGEEVIIKRIIAVEGQKLTLKKDYDGYFYYYLNDVKLNEEYIYSREDMNDSYFNRFCLNLSSSIVIVNQTEVFINIPQGYVFVLGDNRFVSQDSSYFGCVDRNNILGKVFLSFKYNQNFFDYLWEKVCMIF